MSQHLLCPQCGRGMREQTISSLEPVQIDARNRTSQVTKVVIKTTNVALCPVCPNTLGHLVRHLPGQHDQSTHGHRGDEVVGASTSPSAPRANDLALSALEQRMSERYPATHFDFTGCDPTLMEGVCHQLDQLMSKYPEVGKSIAYIGTGKDVPAMYGTDWNAASNEGAFGTMRTIRGNKPPYQVMNLNPTYFGNPALAEAKAQELERQQWLAPGVGKGGMAYMVTHEFGHAVDFYLEGAGKGMKVRSGSDVATDIWQFKGINEKAGNQISYYAQTNQEEQFAESFASLHFTPANQQVGYTKKLGRFLEKTLPGGSSSSWKPMN